MKTLTLAKDGNEEPRIGTVNRWKGKRLLTKAEKLAKQRALAARWRARNREKLRAYFRGYYRQNHETRKAYAREVARRSRAKRRGQPSSPAALAKRRADRAAKRDHINAVHRAWRAKNLQHVQARERRQRQKTIDAKRERDREYRLRCPEKWAASVDRAKAKKPDHYQLIQRASAMARRSRKRSALVERVSKRRIMARDAMRCHLCRQAVDRTDLTFDHLIPVVRQGAYAEWNLMVAHGACNRRRGVRPVLAQETREAAEAYVARRLAEDALQETA